MRELLVSKPKMLMLIDYATCSGCQSCVLACSMAKTGVFSPSQSLITLRKLEGQCVSIPILCEHCQDPPCLPACPTGAITVDPETGVVHVHAADCTGCRRCSAACPFGPETIKFHDNKAVLCDLCGGDPQCSRICQQKAVAYMPVTRAAWQKKWAFAEERQRLLQSQEVL